MHSYLIYHEVFFLIITEKVLGDTCSSIILCADTLAECGGRGTCQCQSGYYDNDGGSPGGTCESSKY